MEQVVGVVAARKGDAAEQSIDMACRISAGGTLFRIFGRQEDLLVPTMDTFGKLDLSESMFCKRFGAEGLLCISSSFEVDLRMVLCYKTIS